jgi:hypothetical protein
MRVAIKEKRDDEKPKGDRNLKLFDSSPPNYSRRRKRK